MGLGIHEINPSTAQIDAVIDDEAIVSELAKVPKSDSTVSWNATALGAINAEVDTALNTAIPASNTANSVNDMLLDVIPAAITALPTDADVNTEVDSALNTAIPGTNTADSVNDILLDQIKPRLPAAGTIATTTETGASDLLQKYLGLATAVFYVNPAAANDSGAGTSPATAKKWTNSAIALCTDGASDLIIRMVGNENIDDDDSDPPIVCNKAGITIIGMGGGHPLQKSEINCSIRRRKSSGWAAAAGPAIEITKPCSIIGLEVVAVAQPGILFSGEGGGATGGFSLIKNCRFVGWGLMTEGIHMDAGAYNQIEGCVFEELTAGIFFDSTLSNNPDYNDIINNRFVGCTYGIDTDTGMNPHNTRVIGNEFNKSYAAAMTYAIRTRGTWDSGLWYRNVIGLPEATAFDDTIANIITDGVTIIDNWCTDS
jgi:hypothetical protein